MEKKTYSFLSSNEDEKKKLYNKEESVCCLVFFWCELLALQSSIYIGKNLDSMLQLHRSWEKIYECPTNLLGNYLINGVGGNGGGSHHL